MKRIYAVTVWRTLETVYESKALALAAAHEACSALGHGWAASISPGEETSFLLGDDPDEEARQGSKPG